MELMYVCNVGGAESNFPIFADDPASGIQLNAAPVTNESDYIMGGLDAPPTFGEPQPPSAYPYITLPVANSTPEPVGNEEYVMGNDAPSTL